MILNSIFCRDEFPNVSKYVYDDRLTKLTVFGENCKPDIWCQLVPFICAGVWGVGGDGAQVPLR